MFYQSFTKITLRICFGSIAKKGVTPRFIKLNDCLPDDDLKVTDNDVIKAFKSLGYKQLIFKKSGYKPVKMKGKLKHGSRIYYI